MTRKTPFLKMHGTGNDFVLLDARARDVSLDAPAVIRVADRHFGIGCDQLLVLKTSQKADAFMQIFNADGSEISTCGNATRCVADFLMRETGKDDASIDTGAGIRTGNRHAHGDVQVNMGAPKFDWQQIPLSVRVEQIDITINTTRSLLIGDHYKFKGSAVLLDPQNRQVLGSYDLISTGDSENAWALSIKDNLAGYDQSIQKFAVQVTRRIIKAIYPE